MLTGRRTTRTAPPLSSVLTFSNRSRVFAAALTVSALLLLPCFWHSQIHGCDLPSHIYNAWLATQVEAGHLPGLHLARQWTNMLFDDVLRYLLVRVGPQWAQRISVSGAVLVFFWGAFTLISKIARRPSWEVMPLLAIVSYGWVFHMGFFNYYISAGLSLFAISLVWNEFGKGLACAVLLLAAAAYTHPLPALWAAGMIGYIGLSRHVRNRGVLLVSAIAGVIGATLALRLAFKTSGSPTLMFITGADQAFVFGRRYIFVQIVLVAVFAHAAILFRRRKPPSGYLIIELAIITGVAIVLLPSKVYIRGGLFEEAASRLSLLQAVLMCAIVSSAGVSKPRLALSSAALIVFAAFIYQDTSVADRVERQVFAATRSLPRGARVIQAIEQPESRVNWTWHILERSCIGHCFAYSNYEPSSNNFRIRVARPNPFVISDPAEVARANIHEYVVRAGDEPIYAAEYCDRERRTICLRLLRAGEKNSPSGER